MLDTLRRIFGDSRPVDLLMLVIEFLVLAIIAGELIYVVIRHFRKQRITKRLFLMFLEGQTLQDAAPVRTSGPNDPEVADWKKRVGSWVSDVTVFLNQKCSRQAAISFRHYVTKARISTGVVLDAENDYVTLEIRLENLRSIIEKLEVYF